MTLDAAIFDTHQCQLGEGPLWHPQREELLWLDINAHQLRSREHIWQFDEFVSAAGWVSNDEILIASETQLFSFDLRSGEQTYICGLESDDPTTRSNDGRADPWGGFWIGTMGKNAEEDAGAIYRYYQGELRKLYGNITISNSICFAPDGSLAYFADTPKLQIMAVRLGADGWPDGDPWVAVDLRTDAGAGAPDGSVVDTQGRIWNAQWGAGRVACYGPDGAFVMAASLPAAHVTCPAFAGGSNRLFCTSATQGVPIEARNKTPEHGMTFECTVPATGQLEHQIIL